MHKNGTEGAALFYVFKLLSCNCSENGIEGVTLFFFAINGLKGVFHIFQYFKMHKNGIEGAALFFLLLNSRGTLPSYASQMAGMSSRIGSGIGTTGPPVGTASGLNSTNHVVPNLQSMRRSSPNSSSQYSQWRIQKESLGGRCSWKFVAIFFVLLSVILVSALIYTTGKSCALVHISAFATLLERC